MREKDFEAFVLQYEKLVFTVCYQLVKDYGEAQNLTQDTFLSAYQHIDDYQGASYKPWLIRIASNKAKDFLRSAYHRKVETADDWDALPMETQKSAEQEAVSKDTALLYSINPDALVRKLCWRRKFGSCGGPGEKAIMRRGSFCRWRLESRPPWRFWREPLSWGCAAGSPWSS